MNKNRLFVHLILTDIRRLKKYIPSLLISVSILLVICTAAAYVISEHIYKKGDYTAVRLAYYIPDNNDSKYIGMATDMLGNMQSMQETAKLCKVNSIEEGYRMLKNGEVLYLLIVPDNFFTGVMDGDNSSLDIIIKDTSTITSYITDELFLSYASYLGIAQAAIYSMLDTVRYHNYPDSEEKLLQDKINIVFLERTLNKNGYTKTIQATNEGSYSLREFYIASAVTISLLFMAIVLMPLLIGRSNGTLLALSVRGINNMHILISNIITSAIAVYIAFIPCYITLSALVVKGFTITGPLSVIPVIITIAVIISLSAFLGRKSLLTANMIAFGLTMLFLYIGGGLLPRAMLPSVIQNLSDYLPGKYMIEGIAAAIFKA